MPALVSPSPHDGGSDPAVGEPPDAVHFGVVVPIHDEEELAPAALAALDRAVRQAAAPSLTIGIAVVLDACRDRSKAVVTEWCRRNQEVGEERYIAILETQVGNVGRARAMGCDALLGQWAGVPSGTVWLATTDADSEVPSDWITAQLRMRSESCQLWAGVVHVRDWSGRVPGTAEAWRRQYEAEHAPVHGANFGIDASLYLEAGGFAGLTSGEDRALLERAAALGATIGHDPSVQVVTSARRQARAPHGFAHALESIEGALASSALAPAS